jgi:hypothetical protein
MSGPIFDVVDIFSKRFEPDGADYLFRPRITAPGIPVSAAERDRFVTEYKRARRLALWGILGPTMIMAIGTSVALDLWGHERAGEIVVYVAIGFSTVLYVIVSQWLYNAPVRALRERAPTIPSRTKVEARRIHFRGMSWSRIVGIAVVAAAAWLRLVPKHDLFVGWNRLWLVGLAVYVLLFLRLAFAKWRSDKGDQAST